MKRIVLAAAALASATFASPAMAQGQCNRPLVQGIADSWIAAVEENNAFKMNLGEWVDFRQNLEGGFLSEFFDRPRKIAAHLTLLDTTACKAFVESVILDPEPTVLSTQLTNGFFGTGPIENLVTDKGDWKFDARAALAAARSEDWSEIPADKRMTRQALIAAANAWLKLDPAQQPVTDGPQYVVDETLGAVNVLSHFGAARRPASHTFRIEDGQVRFVHTAINCGAEANCQVPEAS
jgi:hypothetical protein